MVSLPTGICAFPGLSAVMRDCCLLIPRRMDTVQMMVSRLNVGIMKTAGMTLYPSIAIAMTLAVKAVISRERKIK